MHKQGNMNLKSWPRQYNEKWQLWPQCFIPSYIALIFAGWNNDLHHDLVGWSTSQPLYSVLHRNPQNCCCSICYDVTPAHIDIFSLPYVSFSYGIIPWQQCVACPHSCPCCLSCYTAAVLGHQLMGHHHNWLPDSMAQDDLIVVVAAAAVVAVVRPVVAVCWSASVSIAAWAIPVLPAAGSSDSDQISSPPIISEGTVKERYGVFSFYCFT